MSTTVNGTTGVTFPDGTNQNTSASGFGFKNRIINGAFMIDQRNAGASVSNPNAYTLDRWYVETSLSTTTCQKVGDAPVGFYNSLKFTTTTGGSLSAGSYIDVSQPIEGFNVSDFGFGSASASPVTVSFQVKSSVTGTYSVCLRMPNAGTPVGSVQTITINSANTWESKSVTFTGNTATGLVADNSAQLRLYVILAAGSTYQTSSSNTWVSANGGYNALNTQTNGMLTTTGATFQITGVQLEKGSTATSFDYRPYGTELTLCQRYFNIWNHASNFTEAGSGSWTGSSTQSYYMVQHPVTMRSAPTYAFGGSVLCVNFAGNDGTLSSIGGQSSGTVSGRIGAISSGATSVFAGSASLLQPAAGLANYISASAEL